MQKNYTSICALLILLASTIATVAQNSGIYDAYVVTETNNGGNFYHHLVDQGGFNGAYLGDFTCTNSLILRGGQNKTFKNGGHNVFNGTLFYRVYPTGSPSGGFGAINLDFSQNLANPGDQQWDNVAVGNSANIDLLQGLSPGNYTIEVYTRAQVDTDNNNAVDLDHFWSNFGANFKATFTVYDNTPPSSITATNMAICPGGSSMLEASGGINGPGAQIVWYSGVNGSGTQLGTGPTLEVFPTTTTTYYARREGTCSNSADASIAITVKTLSTALTGVAGNRNVCPNSSTTLTVSGGTDGTGSKIAWYKGFNTTDTANFLAYGATQTVSPSIATSYTVRREGDCNNSAAAGLNLIVLTESTAPTNILATNDFVCPGQLVTLTAEGGINGSGAEIKWYSGPAGTGVQLGTGATLEVSPTSTTTYYARREGNCNTTSDASKTITVGDNEAPSMTCPANVIVSAAPGQCGAVVTYATPTASDNCGAVSVSFLSGLASGATFPPGVTVVRFEAKDAVGNTKQCEFTVTVNDQEDPLIVCPADIVVSNDPGQCGAVVTYSPHVGVDNCPGAVTTLVGGLGSGAFFPVGVTTVTYLVTDASGNIDDCSFTVTVNDTEPPVAFCWDITVNLNSNGIALLVPSDIDIGSRDNCDIASIGVSKDVFDCSNLGTNTVTLTVTDTSGKSASCTAIVTVLDPLSACCQPPIITCPADVTLQCGDSTDPVATGTATYIEGCGMVTINYSDAPSIIICGNSLKFLRTWTATDEKGNMDSCTQLIKVMDATPPVAPGAPANVTVQCADNVPPAIDLTATDNCDGPITVGPSSLITPGACANDFVIVRTWTFTDQCGNTSSVSQTIVVVDFQDPILPAGPANVTVQCADNVPPPVNLTATDNCDGPITVGPSDKIIPGACTNDFVILRTWTFTDQCGNTSSLHQTITVKDTQAPVLPVGPANVTVQCADNVPPAIDLTATDNCDGPITVGPSSVITPGACANDFVIVRTWTFTDQCGNTSSLNQTITVKDTQAPVLPVGPANVTLQCADDVPPPVNLTATDNCDGPITVAPATLFTPGGGCFNNFVLVRIWTFSDQCGNTSSIRQTITVKDTQAPIAACKDITIVLGQGGNVTISPSDVDNGTTDNCALDDLYVFPNNFSAAGVFGVTLTALDECGNLGSCNSQVTVEKRPTVVTNSGVYSGQYSDQVTLSATLIDQITGNPLAGKTLNFDIGIQSTSGITNASGVATANLILDQAPGTYSLVASFAGDAIYQSSSDTDNFDLKQEDAIIDYTGQSLQATTSASSSTTTVDLSVNIQDIADGYRGDIRNATVTFIDVDNGGVVIAGPIPVSTLVNPGDMTLGTVSFPWNVDIGNDAAKSFTVGIRVDAYYTAYDQTVITVYKPVGDFITGGGYIKPTNSAGTYASTDGLRTNFGFNVGYNKKGNKLKGNMNVIFRIEQNDGVHRYQIKGNAMQALGVNVFDPLAKTAEFITKANLADITDPNNPISLGGNYILKVELTDRGEPGSDDSISFNLTDGGTLVFSSNWTGLSTEEIQLSAGNLLVHSGYSIGSTREIAPTASVNTTDTLKLVAWPNPSKAEFNLKLLSAIHSDQIEIRVVDINGRQVYYKQGKANQEYKIGDSFDAGLYIVTVSQGSNVQQVKLVKY